MVVIEISLLVTKGIRMLFVWSCFALFLLLKFLEFFEDVL